MYRNLKKFLVTTTACLTAAASLSMIASAEENTLAPQLTPTSAPTDVVTMPVTTAAEYNPFGATVTTIVTTVPTTTVTGAVLGASTPEDSAATGDPGIMPVFAGLAVTALAGAAAVGIKLRKNNQ